MYSILIHLSNPTHSGKTAALSYDSSESDNVIITVGSDNVSVPIDYLEAALEQLQEAQRLSQPRKNTVDPNMFKPSPYKSPYKAYCGEYVAAGTTIDQWRKIKD